jgi:hypothetical protein
VDGLEVLRVGVNGYDRRRGDCVEWAGGRQEGEGAEWGGDASWDSASEVKVLSTAQTHAESHAGVVWR